MVAFKEHESGIEGVKCTSVEVQGKGMREFIVSFISVT